MPPDPEIFALAKLVGERLRTLRKSIAVAESCTGGLLGAALTDVPGSSAYFLGGVISYADQVKRDQLGVSEATLRRYGAVSEQTAAAMASGVRQLLHADVGVSITGVAGPDAEGSKPVGLSFIGMAAPTLPSPRGGGKREPPSTRGEGDITTSTYRFQWTGDRWDNRRRSVIAALELLVRAPEL
jgi:PncC family amidohydrolase